VLVRRRCRRFCFSYAVCEAAGVLVLLLAAFGLVVPYFILHTSSG
jgi:hypothetical protein